MKSLQILGLLMVLVFSSVVFAEEREKSKEVEKSKEIEKPKEVERPKTTDPHGFIVQIWSHSRNRKVPLNPLPDVTGIELIFDETLNDDSNNELCFPDQLPGIAVITKANNPNSDALVYHYAVSGGRVIGKGENVIWNLSGVKPGTYTITAAVDDGCGFCGKTVTRTVTVKE